MTSKVLISLPGMGVHSIMQLVLLCAIEKKIRQYQGPEAQLIDYVDLFAAYSAGSYIVFPLILPPPFRLTVEEAEHLFIMNPQSCLSENFYTKWMRRLKSLVRPRYGQRIAQLLGPRAMGPTFMTSKMWLSELKKDLVISAMDVQDGPLLMSTYQARQDPANDYLIEDVILATTALPTILPATDFLSRTGKRRTCIDGVFTSGDIMVQALIHAKIHNPSASWLAINIDMGLRATPAAWTEEKIGFKRIVKGILIGIDAGLDANMKLIAPYLPDIKFIQIRLEKRICSSLDQVRMISKIQAQSQHYVDNHEDRIDEIARIILKHKGINTF